jgi:hypothetical protein
MNLKRRWKFYAVHDQGGCYLGEENIFTGNMQEAGDEADRRAEAFENETDRIICRIVMESKGIVTH